ncbi:MAG: NAD-dependent epimerase/dehydratase family protein [Ruthenibacterium sp.]
MRALFIGGSGIISTAVTRLALAQGWEVTLLNRGVHAQPSHAHLNNIRGDIHEEAVIATLLAGENFDTVIDFIAYTPDEIARDIRLFRQKTAQYIFISSTSAYAKPLPFPVTETCALGNVYWSYAQEKERCENLLMQEYQDSHFPVTIVRPSHTYSEQSLPLALHGANGPWQTLARMLHQEPVLIPGDGTSLWTVTHSDDVAVGIVGLMGHASAIGQAYHITGDEALAWNSIYAILGDALGTTPVLAHVSSDFLVACNPALQGALLGDKANTSVFDNTKIKQAVSAFGAVISAKEGLQKSVRHILKTPQLQKADPVFDAWCNRVLAAVNGAKAQYAAD